MMILFRSLLLCVAQSSTISLAATAAPTSGSNELELASGPNRLRVEEATGRLSLLTAGGRTLLAGARGRGPFRLHLPLPDFEAQLSPKFRAKNKNLSS